MNSTINEKLPKCPKCRGFARELGSDYSDWIVMCENYPSCPQGVLAETRKGAQKAWRTLVNGMGV